MDGFEAQLVELRTGNAKVMGSIPVEARFFFMLKTLLHCTIFRATCFAPALHVTKLNVTYLAMNKNVARQVAETILVCRTRFDVFAAVSSNVLFRCAVTRARCQVVNTHTLRDTVRETLHGVTAPWLKFRHNTEDHAYKWFINPKLNTLVIYCMHIHDRFYT